MASVKRLAASGQDALIALSASGDPRTTLIALLLDADLKTRDRQLAAVRAKFGGASMMGLAQVEREWRALTPPERTVALDTHLPKLRDVARAELERLAATLRALEAADVSVDLFEYAITRRALDFIRDLLEPHAPHGRQPISEYPDELQLVFSLVARHSAPGTPRQAFEKGMRRLGMEFDRAYQPTAQWGRALDAALDRLEQLKPVAKELMLEGLQATMQFDQHESAAERELLRVVATSLHCPVPR